jgi:hypothetical protein
MEQICKRWESPFISALLTLAVVLALLVPGAAVPSASAQTASPSEPWIKTGQSDYEPAATVTYTGAGFEADETVNLLAVGNTNLSRVTSQTRADSSGAISGSFVIPPVYEEVYALKATGLSSGRAAETSFLDALGSLQITPTNPPTLHPGDTQDFIVNANGSSLDTQGVPLTWSVSPGGGTLNPTSNKTCGPAGGLVPPCTGGLTTGQAKSTYTAGSTAGDFSITVLGGGKSDTQDVKVRLATSLSVAPATGTEGGTITLSATLTSSGNAVSGKTINFTLNGNAAGSAVTNASGVASTSASLGTIAPGTYPTGVGASYNPPGNETTYDGSSGTASLTVNSATPADTAAPTVTVTFGTPEGLNGWFITSPVTGTVIAADSSNVTDISCTGATVGTKTGLNTTNASAPLSVSTEGTSNVSCTATDGATPANTGAASGSSNTATIKLDSVKPTLTLGFTPSSPDGSNGWYKATGGVGFTWTCSDATSGIDTSYNSGCPNPLTGTVTDQGTTNFADQVKDQAGNSSDAVSTSIKLDNVAPTGVSGAPNRAADSNGWYNHPVDIVFGGTDATSGINTCTITEYSGPDTSNTSVNGSCKDNAGNESSPVASSSFKYDATKPTVSFTGVSNNATYPLGSVPTAGCSTTDATSGVKTNATVAVTGGTSNGVGEFTVNCSGAQDNAGNSQAALTAIKYKVEYAGLGNILQPINPDNTSAFNRGQAVPVKFQLGGDPSGGFNTSAWNLDRVSVSCGGFDAADEVAEPATSVNPSNAFRYDASADQYIFNADLRQQAVGTCWKAKVTLDSGQIVTSAIFKLTGK